jgi:hypothetical protein
MSRFVNSAINNKDFGSFKMYYSYLIIIIDFIWTVITNYCFQNVLPTYFYIESY